MTARGLHRRACLAGLIGAATQPRCAWAVYPLEEKTLTLAINEAATGSVTIGELIRRYDPLARVIARAAGSPVRTNPFIDVRLFLGELGANYPAFIFAKTVDILAEQVTTNRYVPLVKINKPYVAGVILSEASKAKTLADLVGFDVLLPPPETMTAKLAIAAFHDAGLEVVVKDPSDAFPTGVSDKVTVRHVAFQEVIPATLSQKFWYKAGVVNPTMMAKWTGKVLQKFKPQPNWSIAAKAGTSPDVIKAVIDGLTKMHTTTEGAAALSNMTIEKFVPSTRAEYVALANYVK